MEITAYRDVEYWTCPRGACRAHTTYTPENEDGRGRETHLEEIKRPDRTKVVSDWKRNTERKNLTAKRRKELGID